LEGDLEELPLEDEVVDIIISNCVLNLVPNKPQVFAEMYRTLRKGGHFCVSDIVLQGELPSALKKDAEMYAGCVSGAIQKEDYLQGLIDAGFEEVEIVRTKPTQLPDELLDKDLNPIELSVFRTQGARIQSVTVFGKKGLRIANSE
jgi:SAM-dependent methyltransferase